MTREAPLPSVGALFLPTRASRLLVTVTATWLVLGSGCSTAVAAKGGMLTILLGVGVVPVGAGATFLAALLARTAAARATLYGLTALLLSLGATLLAITDFDSGFDVGSLLVAVILYAVPVAVTATLALFFGTRAAREVEERLEERRTERLRRELARRGEASFEELAAASGHPESVVDDVLDHLHETGLLAVVLDPDRRRAFTTAAYASKEPALIAAVHQRGRLALYDLAQQLDLSEARLREVVYAALEHGRFSGYADWRRGILFSSDAQRLREGRACPHCGGPMDLAGRGAIACPYCGTEVLLG